MVRGLEGERTTRMTVFDKKGVMACPVRGETCRLPQDIDVRGLNMARFNHLKSGARWFEFFCGADRGRTAWSRPWPDGGMRWIHYIATLSTS